MHVNTDGLRSGANKSYTAADHAYEGAGRLSRVSADGGIFGDFPAATSFQQAVDGAHKQHVTTLKAHYEKLGSIADKAHGAAADFDDMERTNEAQLRAVGEQA